MEPAFSVRVVDDIVYCKARMEHAAQDFFGGVGELHAGILCGKLLRKRGVDDRIERQAVYDALLRLVDDVVEAAEIEARKEGAAWYQNACNLAEDGRTRAHSRGSQD